MKSTYPARAAREAKGLSANDAARKLGLPPKNGPRRVLEIERRGGLGAGAKDRLIYRMARLYGCAPETIAMPPNYLIKMGRGG